MREFLRRPWVLLTAASLMTSTVVFSQHGTAGESPQITDGSNVTLSYDISVPGEDFKVRDVGRFCPGETRTPSRIGASGGWVEDR